MFWPTPHMPTFPPRSELEWCCWWVYILFDINHEFCMIWSPESGYLHFFLHLDPMMALIQIAGAGEHELFCIPVSLFVRRDNAAVESDDTTR